MRVIHFPYGAENPYQLQLIEALERQGAETLTRKQIAWRLLDRVLFQWKVDAIHFHWLHPFAAKPSGIGFAIRIPFFALQLFILRLLGRKIVWTVHNLQGHEKKNLVRDRLISRLMARMANHLIVHDRSSKKQVAEFFAISPNKIEVIPHGNYAGYYSNDIDREDAREKLGLPRDTFVYLGLGAIRRYKGMDKFIRSFRKVQGEDCRLLIVGSPQPDELKEELTAESAGDPRVQLRFEFIDDEEIQTYMNAADVVVFPYENILTSGAVVLAMSFGKPCVAPLIGGIPDVLDPEGAFLYGQDEEGGLDRVLTEAHDRAGDLAEMGSHNQKKSNQWDWDTIARMTLEVYGK